MQRVLVRAGRTTIGSASKCDLVLSGEGIASEHAAIEVAGPDATLHVLPSAPAASINGVRVRQAGLVPGDSIHLGEVQLDVLKELAQGAQIASVELARSPASRKGLRFPPGIVAGRSPRLRVLYEQLAGSIDSRLPLLILGETGSGKEHIAQVVHASSARHAAPFVTINCAAIPAELLETELFGIARGVATGVEAREGKFREAHGGTIFLDEVGELPLALQAKLLRALEEKTLQPVGGRAAAVDVRVIAATNARLDGQAGAGGFRLDLYHRLAGFVVEVPALRERTEDIPVLADHFLRQEQVGAVSWSQHAVTALLRYHWPGNVRELRHEAARIATRVSGSSIVDLVHLSAEIAAALETEPVVEMSADASSLDGALMRLERSLLEAALERHRGNVTHAASQLGISRVRLRRRTRELGLRRDVQKLSSARR